jgi:serine/threonine-protein kinase
VVESLPDPRTQLEIGKTVTLVVSRGRENVDIPDVTELDRDGARSRLERLDLEVVFRERETDDEEPGQVLSQDPVAGTEVEKGSRVTVTVAKEPAEAEVPEVIGEDINDATDALNEAGFRVRQEFEEVETPEEDGVVIDQTPAGASRQKKGSRVTLTVGRFNPDLDPEPTPTATASPEGR